MFGDITEAANQITAAFAQLNQNLARQIELQEREVELLADIKQLLEKKS